MRPPARSAFPEAFSTSDLARASGRSRDEIAAWVEAGAIRMLPVGDGRTWLSRTEAVRAARALLAGTLMPAAGFLGGSRTELFGPGTGAESAWRGIRVPLALSTSLHAGLIAALIAMTMLGFGRVDATGEAVDRQPMRLVYLAIPGPGGGGGGGGLKHATKPPRAERKGSSHLDSPIPRRPPPEPDSPRPPEPLPDVKPLPPVQAPVAEAPANERDRIGLPEPMRETADSHGPGSEGGVGDGKGSGVGEGQGSGLGEGEGGGTGGGPYRPGSGITPPTLLREVKPDYTEEARRLGIRGDVVMEIVVRRDGRVGDVRVLQGLGHGLDERAVTAVRQWSFSPATRRGAPVDVMVEVAMEFKLR
jgi:periplasmic protein TonB